MRQSPEKRTLLPKVIRAENDSGYPCRPAGLRETGLYRVDTYVVVAGARIVEHRVQLDVLQVYLHVVVARLALVELDRGPVSRQRQHRRQRQDRGTPPRQPV